MALSVYDSFFKTFFFATDVCFYVQLRLWHLINELELDMAQCESISDNRTMWLMEAVFHACYVVFQWGGGGGGGSISLNSLGSHSPLLELTDFRYLAPIIQPPIITIPTQPVL